VPSNQFVDLYSNQSNIAGNKGFTGKITTAASSASSAGFNLAQGIAPSSPVLGDLWMNASNVLSWRAGGSTIQIAGLSVVQTWSASQTFSNGINVSSGNATFAGLVNLRSYTVATLPVATTAGGIVYVSDAAVAPCLAFANGTNWKRCDNAATTVV
jgi:hypothetical protein